MICHRIIFLMLLATGLVACAPTKREVNGNTFSSNRPSINVQVSDDFAYQGHKRGQEDYQHVLAPLGRTAHLTYDTYTFLRKTKIPSGVIIVITESDGIVYFGSPNKTSGNLSDWEYSYDYSKTTPVLLQQTYLERGKRSESNKPDRCNMVKESTLYFGPEHMLKAEIIYLEALQYVDVEDLQCQNWKPHLADLSEAQKIYLSKFADRAAESFQMEN